MRRKSRRSTAVLFRYIHHLREGASRAAAGRGGGFALAELVVAAGILLVIGSAVVFTTIQTTQGVRRAVDSQGADVAMASAVAHLLTADYTSVVGGTFVPYQPCSDDPDASCVKVGEADYRISYSVDTERSGVSSDNIAVATLTAQNGSGEVIATRDVALTPPIPGLNGDSAVVRVSYVSPRGDDSAENPPTDIDLTLVHLDGTQAAGTATARFSETGVAYFTPDNGACTEATPCFVGVGTGTQWWRADQDGADVAVSGAASPKPVVPDDSGMAVTQATPFKVSSAQAELLAERNNGERWPAKDTSSICMWLTFTDAGVERTVPVCNHEVAESIDISVFTQDGVTYPIATGTPVAISVDHPTGSCLPIPGQKGHTANEDAAWQPRAVCTSYTWGYPATFGPRGLSTQSLGDGSATYVVGEHATYEIVWSGPAAIPAVGYTGESTWTRPREAAACSLDATCVALGADRIPEVDDCPGRHCYSVANTEPELQVAYIADGTRTVVNRHPQTGAYVVDIEAGTPAIIELSATDPELDRISVDVISAPQGGDLEHEGTKITADDVPYAVIDGEESGSATNLVYSTTRAFQGTAVLVAQARDDRGRTSSEAIINLVADPVVSSVTGEDITVNQGDTNVDLVAEVWKSDGTRANGVTVLFSSVDEGITIPNPTAVTNQNGVATVKANFPTATQGAHSIQLAVSGAPDVTGELTVTVAAQLEELSVEDAAAAQGSEANVTYRAKDMHGQGMGGVNVTTGVVAGPSFSRGSNAYDEDGSAHPAGEPRYVSGRSGRAILIEGPGENLLTEGSSSFETAHGWGTGNHTGSSTTAKSWHGASSLGIVTQDSDPVLAETTVGVPQPGTYTVTGRVLLPLGWDGGEVRMEGFGTEARSVSADGGTSGMWQEISTTFTATSTSGTLQLTTSEVPSEGLIVYFDAVTLEAGTDSTSYIPGGATRAAETLSFPAGWLNPAAGTIEMWVEVTPNLRTGGDAYLLSSPYLNLRRAGDEWILASGDGTDTTEVSAADDLADGWHLFTVRWEGNNLGLYIDGELAASDADASLPDAWTGAEMRVGSALNGTGHANTAFDELRVARIARGESVISAAANVDRFSGEDTATLLLMRNDAGTPSTQGISITSTCTTDVDGTCSVQADVSGNTQAGVYPLEVTSGDYWAVGRFVVSQTPDELLIPDFLTVAQNNSVDLGATVLDTVGAPVEGALVAFGEATDRFDLSLELANTDHTGSVITSVEAPAGAEPGTDEVEVLVNDGSIRGTVDVSVVSAAASAHIQTALLIPEMVEELTVEVRDGAGQPLPAAMVKLSDLSGQVFVGGYNQIDDSTAVGATDNDGKVTFSLWVPLTVAPGLYEDYLLVDVDDGVVTTTADYTVVNTSFSFAIDPTHIVVDQNGTTTATITALNNIGEPVGSGQMLILESQTEGLSVTPNQTNTNQQSQQALEITAGPIKAGTHEITVSGMRITTPIPFGVTVNPVFDSLSPIVDPALITEGEWTEVGAETLDVVGDPMPGVEVRYVSTSPDVEIAYQPSRYALGWWRLNESSGSPIAADASGNGNDAIATGVNWEEPSPRGDGEGTGAYLPNGTASLETPIIPSDDLSGGTNAFTFEAWVSVDTIGETQYLFGSEGSAPHLFARIDPDGELEVGAGEGIFETGVYLEEDEWHHLVISIDQPDDPIDDAPEGEGEDDPDAPEGDDTEPVTEPGVVSVYVDGDRAAQSGLEVGDPDFSGGWPETALTFGTDFDGRFDEIAVYAAAHGIDEARTAYEAQTDEDGAISAISNGEGRALFSARALPGAGGTYPVTATSGAESTSFNLVVSNLPASIEILPVNVAPNGGFEEGIDGWTGAAWDNLVTYAESAGAASRTTTSGSIDFEAIGTDTTDPAYLAPVKEGQVVSISARLRVDDEGTWVNLRGIFLDSNLEPLDIDPYVARSAVGEPEAVQTDSAHVRDTGFIPYERWQRFDLEGVVVPEGAAFLAVEAFTESDTDATFWVDDLRVTFPDEQRSLVVGDSVTVAVEVLDGSQRPVSGASVSLDASAADVWVDDPTVVTGPDGIARFELNVEPTASIGAFNLIARYSTNLSHTVAFAISDITAPGLVATYRELDGASVNVAQQAEITVTDGEPKGLVDGRYGVGAAASEEWQTSGAQSAVFDVGSGAPLTAVVLYDRAGSPHAGDVVVEFSQNGTVWTNTQAVTDLPDDGSPRVIPLTNTTARYVRVSVEDAGLSEVKILSADVTSLTSAATVASAESELSEEFTAAATLDGSTNTSWASADGSADWVWLRLDLGREAFIHYAEANGVYFDSGSGVVQMEVSEDGVNYHAVSPPKSLNVAHIARLVLDRPTRARYVRFLFQDASSQNVRVAEAKVFGAFTEPTPQSGTAYRTEVVSTVDFESSDVNPYLSGRSRDVAVSLDGYITIENAGEYTFYVDGTEDVELRIDDETLVSLAATETRAWADPLVGDFDGDHEDDLGLYDIATGELWVATGADGRFGSLRLWGEVAPGARVSVIDWGSDNDADVAWVSGDRFGVAVSDHQSFEVIDLELPTHNFIAFDGSGTTKAEAAGAPAVTEFGVEVDVVTNWTRSVGTEGLIGVWGDEGERSWWLTRTASGHLRLLISWNGISYISYVSTAPVSDLADDGKLTTIGATFSHTAFDSEVTFTVDGIQLGDVVVDPQRPTPYAAEEGEAILTLGPSAAGSGEPLADIYGARLYDAEGVLLASWDTTGLTEGATVVPDGLGNVDLSVSPGISTVELHPRGGTSAWRDEAPSVSEYSSAADVNPVTGDFTITVDGATDWFSQDGVGDLVSKWDDEGDKSYRLSLTETAQLHLEVMTADGEAQSFVSAPLTEDAALSFDGDDVVDIGTINGIGAGGPFFERSVEAIITPTSIPGPNDPVQVIFEAGGTTNGHNLYLYNGHLYAHFYSNNTGWLEGVTVTTRTSGITLVEGETYHVVATMDASNRLARLYVNGEKVAETPGPAAMENGLNDHTNAAAIGGVAGQTKVKLTSDQQISGDDYGFVGVIDNVAVYGATLTEDRIAAHHRASDVDYNAQVLADTPIAYYPLDGDGTALVGPDAVDVTGTEPADGAVGISDGEFKTIRVAYDTYDPVTGSSTATFLIDGVALGEPVSAPSGSVTDFGRYDYEDLVASDNPIAWWRFDPSEDRTAADHSGNGNDATLHGEGLFIPSGIGDDTGSLAFGGHTDPSQIAASNPYLRAEGLEVPSSEGEYTTVEMWVQFPEAGNLMFAGFDRYSPQTNGYDLYMWDGRLGFNVGNSTHWSTDESFVAEHRDRWTHIVAAFHNGDVRQSRLWVDGEEQALSDHGNNSVEGRPGYVSETLHISGWPLDNNYRTPYARYDEIAIYDGLLSEQSIRDHYEAGAPTYEQVVLSDNPVAYWPLGSGHGAEDLAGGPDVSFNAGQTVGNSTGRLLRSDSYGRSGNSTDFILNNSGVSQCRTIAAGGSEPANAVCVQSRSELQLNEDLTIEMWVRPDQSANRATIFGKSFAGEFLVNQEPNGQIRFYHGHGTSSGQYYSLTSSNGPLTVGRLTHIVVTRDHTEKKVRIYADGVLVAEGSYASAAQPAKTPYPVTFGDNYIAGSYEGLLGHVSIYDYPFEDDQVRAHFEAGIKSSTLMRNNAEAAANKQPPGYWTFDDGPAATVATTSGSRAAYINSYYRNGASGVGPSLTSDGTKGSAYFDGENDWVEVDDEDYLNTRSNGFPERTIVATFLAEDVQRRQVIFEGGGTTNGNNLYIQGGRVYAGFWSGANGWADGTFVSAPIEAGRVYNVIATMDSATDETRLYLNGDLADTATIEMGAGLAAHTDDMGIGASESQTKFHNGTWTSSNPGNFFGGYLDDLAIYIHAMSPETARKVAEVTLWGAGVDSSHIGHVRNGGFEHGLSGWDADGAAVTIEDDVVRSGMHAARIEGGAVGDIAERGISTLVRGLTASDDFQASAWVYVEGANQVAVQAADFNHTYTVPEGEWVQITTPVVSTGTDGTAVVAIAPVEFAEPSSSLIVDDVDVTFLPAANQSFEAPDTQGWKIDAYGAEVSEVTGYNSPTAVRFTLDGDEPNHPVIYTADEAITTGAVEAGDLIRVTADVRGSGLEYFVVLRYYDGTGQRLGGSYATADYPSAYLPTTASWQTFDATWEVPEGAESFSVLLRARQGGEGYVDFDNVRITAVRGGEAAQIAQNDEPIVVGAKHPDRSVHPFEIRSVQIHDGLFAEGEPDPELLSGWDYTKVAPKSFLVPGIGESADATLYRNDGTINSQTVIDSTDGAENITVGALPEGVVVLDPEVSGAAWIITDDGMARHVVGIAAVSREPWRAHPADLDGTGAADDIILRADEAGTWVAVQAVADTYEVTDTHSDGPGAGYVGDFDGDGDTDVLTVTDTQVLVTETEANTWGGSTVWLENPQHIAAVVTDADADGDDDLYVANGIDGIDLWASEDGSFGVELWDGSAGAQPAFAAGVFDGEIGTVTITQSGANVTTGSEGPATWLDLHRHDGTWECAPDVAHTIGEPSDCARVNLAAGPHDISIWARTANGSGALRLAYSGPDTGDELEIVPAGALSHQGPSVVVADFDPQGGPDDETVTLQNPSDAVAATGTYTFTNEAGEGASAELYLHPGSQVVVHTGEGQDSNGHLYLRLEEELWGDDTGTITVTFEPEGAADREIIITSSRYGLDAVRIGRVAVSGADGILSEDGGEAITLVNTSPWPADIGGLRLKSASTTHVLPAHTLPAYGAVTVHSEAGTDDETNLYLGVTDWLANEAGYLEVAAPDLTPLDGFSWGR